LKTISAYTESTDEYSSRDTVPLMSTALKLDISGCRGDMGDMKQAEIQTYAFIYSFSYLVF
jgi:hypothetical protein